MNPCYPSCNERQYCDCRPVPWPGDHRHASRSPYICTIRNGLLVRRRVPALLTYGVLREVSIRQIDFDIAPQMLFRIANTVFHTGKPHYTIRDGQVWMVTP